MSSETALKGHVWLVELLSRYDGLIYKNNITQYNHRKVHREAWEKTLEKIRRSTHRAQPDPVFAQSRHYEG